MSDSEIKITVGEGANGLKGFVHAWHRAEGGDYRTERVLAFESWEALASVLTTERYRMLRHLHDHPAKSINALAGRLGRQYRRVHEDVRILGRAGLVDLSEESVTVT
jgi:Predicted transcriptional regulator